MSVKPIKPEEVTRAKIPDVVFEATNELIVRKWDGHDSIFREDDLVDLILTKLGGRKDVTARQTLFDKGWLDFEDIYREAGWEVRYDKPAYNETYPATFEFRRAK